MSGSSSYVALKLPEEDRTDWERFGLNRVSNREADSRSAGSGFECARAMMSTWVVAHSAGRLVRFRLIPKAFWDVLDEVDLLELDESLGSRVKLALGAAPE